MTQTSLDEFGGNGAGGDAPDDDSETDGVTCDECDGDATVDGETASADAGEHDGEAGGETDVDESAASVDASEDIDTVEPPTSQWHTEGVVCAVCGEQTTRCWRDDGQLVCPDCKNWA
jgi:hypothetical protein